VFDIKVIDKVILLAYCRVQLIRDIGTEFQLSTSLLRLQAPANDRPLMDVADALAAGPGDLGVRARPHHPGLLVQWDVGCGNVRSELMPSLEQLETAAGYIEYRDSNLI